MMRIWMLRVLGALAALMPRLAMADDSVPESIWVIYAPVSGSAIYEVLTGVALMLERNGGGLVGVMLTLAIMSVIALAAKIGTGHMAVSQFLTYLLTVWVIAVTTFNIKVNVVVADRASNYYNVVDRVPILFAAPAALISQVGALMTDKIEQYMSTPDQLKLTTGRQFNLIGKVVADSDSLKITDPSLRASVANYVSDCAIPGMARGQISMATLRTSTNIWADLRFNNEGVRTRYRPMSAETVCEAATAAGVGEDGAALLSCAKAHTCIAGDISRFAEEFDSADLGDLAASGTLNALGPAMTSSHLWLTGAQGASDSGASYLRQRIMANSIGGAYRSAAAQAGNNELITTAAITQAEEGQKSTWVAGAAIFNDLMGYIYIICQVMVYALAPFVAMLLLAPGFGLKGGLSYIQVMVWLALWEPLLSVVNFVVALFAKSSIGGVLITEGGYTLASSPLISEQANNLMMAAGFLGTMVPVLAWNVARGSISLMEFANAAGGGTGASQAGNTASTGNLSLDNMSMGNRSMNKADYVNSLKFGSDQLQASNAPLGAMLKETQVGGESLKANAQLQGKDTAVTAAASAQLSYGKSIGMSAKASDAVSAMRSAGTTLSGAFSEGSTTTSMAGVTSSQGATSKEEAANQAASGIAKSLNTQYQALNSTAEDLTKTLGAMAGFGARDKFTLADLKDRHNAMPAGAQRTAMGQGLSALGTLAASGLQLAEKMGTPARVFAGVAGVAAAAAGSALAVPAATAIGMAATALSVIDSAGANAGVSTGITGSVRQMASEQASQASSLQSDIRQLEQFTEGWARDNGIAYVSSTQTTGQSGWTMTRNGTQTELGSQVASASQHLEKTDTLAYTRSLQNGQTDSITYRGSPSLRQFEDAERLAGAGTASFNGGISVEGPPSLSAASSIHAAAQGTYAQGLAQATSFGGAASAGNAAAAGSAAAAQAHAQDAREQAVSSTAVPQHGYGELKGPEVSMPTGSRLGSSLRATDAVDAMRDRLGR